VDIKYIPITFLHSGPEGYISEKKGFGKI